MIRDKKSILMFDAAFPPPVTGGKEKQAFILTKALLKRNVKVEAFSYAHNNSVTEIIDGIKIKRINKGLLSIFLFFLFMVKKRFHFDIIHIHTPSRIGKLIAFMGFLLGYRVFFKFPNEGMLDNLSLLSKVYWRLLFRVVSVFIVLEENTVKKLKSLKVKSDKIFYIYNGVELRNKLVMASGGKELNLIFVGRLEDQKLCDQLILACDILSKKGLEFRLAVVGDGTLYGELNNLTSQLGLKEKIKFYGHQDNVIKYMLKADVLILPSHNEGMSNVLLEAISIGLPVVATDVGAAKVQLGLSGEKYLCEPYNPNCIASKIMLLSDDCARKEYGNSLYVHCNDAFGIDVIAGRYLEQYNKKK